MKKIVVLFILVCYFMTGCNNASGLTDPAIEPTKPVATSSVQNTSAQTTSMQATPAETTAETPADDPIGVLLSTWSSPLNEVCLLRGENIYTLSAAGPYNEFVSYAPIQERQKHNYVALFYGSYRHVSGNYISCGDVPVPEIGKSDKVIYYKASAGPYPNLKLIPVDFVGYSFSICDSGDWYIEILDKNGERFIYDKYTDIQVVDMNGGIVRSNNYVFSNKGGAYTVSWDEKIQSSFTKFGLNSVDVVADCSLYSYNPSFVESYRVFIDKTVEFEYPRYGTIRYAEYDISHIPPGLYAICEEGNYSTEGRPFIIRIAGE